MKKIPDYNTIFPVVSTSDWYPLKIRKNIAKLDRDIGLLRDLSEIFPYKTICIAGTETFGYVACNMVGVYSKIYHYHPANSGEFVADEITQSIDRYTNQEIDVLYISDNPPSVVSDKIPIVISYLPVMGPNYRIFRYISGFISVHSNYWPEFYSGFRYYITGDRFEYDNLINLCIMVKNAGESFREILTKNLPYIDRWTILDTGSTDNTVDIAQEVLRDKKGILVQEPFINFRDSRNRLLDIAGDYTAFNVMLDDTYILNGDLRGFLGYVRSDDVADSFSVFIKESDMVYSSNRITKPHKKLRYIHLVHEVIQNNMNVSIPIEKVFITDISSTYMKTRTSERKYKDIAWLQEEINEFPNDPRQYYYMAETYLFLKEYKQAYDWYIKRARHPVGGYVEEKYDAIYKAAVMGDLFLEYDWNICMALYLEAYEYDPVRPESLFQIGEYYSRLGYDRTSYLFYRTAFLGGLPPKNYNMNIKTDMYCLHLPKRLIPLCYKYRDFDLGQQACTRLCDYKPGNEYGNYWMSVFYLLNQSSRFRCETKLLVEPVHRETIIFVIPGGWGIWSGITLYEKGLGGSETCVIKYSEILAREFNVLVFCNCGEDVVIHNSVKYVPIGQYPEMIAKLSVKVAFINRYTEYIPVTVENKVQNYIILHDLCRTDDVVPECGDYFKGIICLTDWHIEYTKDIYPLTHIDKLSYGICVDDYNPAMKTGNRNSPRFIYPSFPNRGLIHLLRIFPIITAKYPLARLDLFINLDLPWVKNILGKEGIDEIQGLITSQPNIYNHGWVPGKTLREYWSMADIWFYTCDFYETFCLVGLEAAASKTLAITSDIGALRDTVGDRGIMIPGPANDGEWMSRALPAVFQALDGTIDTQSLVARNYEWTKGKSYENVVSEFRGKYI